MAFLKLPRIKKQGKLFEKFLSNIRQKRPVRCCRYRTRTNRNEFHLDDKEQYILDEKFRLSCMKSKSAFIRKLILYGYVYDVDYSFYGNTIRSLDESAPV